MGYPFEDGVAVNAALDVFARIGKKELQWSGFIASLTGGAAT